MSGHLAGQGRAETGGHPQHIHIYLSMSIPSNNRFSAGNACLAVKPGFPQVLSTCLSGSYSPYASLSSETQIKSTTNGNCGCRTTRCGGHTPPKAFLSFSRSWCLSGPPKWGLLGQCLPSQSFYLYYL